MNKAELKVLERIFTAEIEGRLPCQLGANRFKPSKVVRKLEAEGYIRHETNVLPGRFPVTVSGWALTLKGHYTWCSHCATLPGVA